MSDPVLPLAVAGRDAVARAAALAAPDDEAGGAPPMLVGYRSRGRVLVIGPGPYALEQAAALPAALDCAVLATDTAGAGAEVPLLRGAVQEVRGYLGRFVVTAVADGREFDVGAALGAADGCFDLVLDLQREPSLRRSLPPPGYYAPMGDMDALHHAVGELPHMVGDFDKPQYVRLDPARCAHGASGIQGCRRCLDLCPADAIAEAGAKVAVDPYLCQGGGACASACPSGALRYTVPAVDTLVARLRTVLEAYRDAGGEHPLVLLYGAEAGAEWLAGQAAELPGHVIPMVLEEAAGAGLEAWLALLALGAAAVTVLVDPRVPDTVATEIERQRVLATALLDGLGLPPRLVRTWRAGDPPDWACAASAVEPATFAIPDDKRTALRMALDHLHRYSPLRPAVVPLPAGAPFGDLQIDPAACTLCMACVGLFPASALSAAGDRPALQFIEQNCVQCALCVNGCPERALRLQPRLLFEIEARRARRVLHQEAAFCCIECGKPFATAAVIARMRERLAGNPMFTGDGLRRLEMCEDCRVQDLFRDGGGTLDDD